MTEKIYGTCAHCGKPITQPGRKKFCCTECHRAFDEHRKEYCADCGVKLTIENTYCRGYGPDGKPWMDNYCKSCRIDRNRASYLKRREKAGVGKPKQGRQTNAAREKICGNDEPLGNPRAEWIKKMQKFPLIFVRIFHKPATIENICQEVKSLYGI